MSQTKLYHCTDYNSLCNILKSGAFWPSFCYEKADYLPEPENFAFAMVCFADFMKNEVKPHLKKFNKKCYLRMSKTWARRKGLSNVIYYNYPSVVASTFRLMIDKVARQYEDNDFVMTDEVRYTSMMMAYFKQYEWGYWNENKGCWDDKNTQFYTEREWRYVPLVQNYEAYYLSPDEFHDKAFRKEKRQQLIDHGYTLKFGWEDLEQIGVGSLKQWVDICNYYVNGLKYNSIEVFKKVKIIW